MLGVDAAQKLIKGDDIHIRHLNVPCGLPPIARTSRTWMKMMIKTITFGFPPFLLQFPAPCSLLTAMADALIGIVDIHVLLLLSIQQGNMVHVDQSCRHEQAIDFMPVIGANFCPYMTAKLSMLQV
jgi:hypothetical protein